MKKMTIWTRNTCLAELPEAWGKDPTERKKERKAKEEKDKKDIPQNLSHDRRRQRYYYTTKTYIPPIQYSFCHIYP